MPRPIFNKRGRGINTPKTPAESWRCCLGFFVVVVGLDTWLHVVPPFLFGAPVQDVCYWQRRWKTCNGSVMFLFIPVNLALQLQYTEATSTLVSLASSVFAAAEYFWKLLCVDMHSLACAHVCARQRASHNGWLLIKGLFEYGSCDNWKRRLSVVLPSFFFCFIVVIWFCRWLVCRAFNFHPLFSMLRRLFLTVLHSVVSRESRDSVIHPSDLLWVWIPLPHPRYCLPFDLYHTCKHALCNFPFHCCFNLKNPAPLNCFTAVGSFFLADQVEQKCQEW